MNKRHIIFISLIVFGLLIAVISITYALNTTIAEGTSTDYDLLYTFDISGGSSWNVTVDSGKTKVYEIALNNPYDDSIKYGVIYKVNNYDSTPEGVSVTTTSDSTSLPEDLIGSDTSKTVSVMIENTTSSSITVNLGIVNGYKNGGDLIIPSGYSIVESYAAKANSPDLVDGLIPVTYNSSTDKWVIADTTAESVTATCTALGDVNGDGSVDLLDVTRLQRILSGTNTTTNEQLVCADVDGNGIVEKNDMLLISNYANSDDILTFPAGEPLSQKTGLVAKINQWYDYDNKMWANAVLVTSTNRSAYQNASAGTEVSSDDILAFYVWIPRYKYKVWNKNKVVGTDSYNARTTGIDIVFENEKSSTGTINCTYSYATASSSANSPNETCTGSDGDYYTHPAFTFGNTQVRGFWIGKYEFTGNSSSLTILPNQTSLRSQTVSSFSTIVQNMQVSSNIYGLNTSRTNADSHMLTNYEWGAVAYLTNSKYGRCTNGSCIEVTINNCSSYITGIGADSVSASSSSTTCTTAANKYNGAKGVLASTTGNVYGVYDMSGGTNEYTMGNISSGSGSYTFYPGDSGFVSGWYTTNNNSKYITTYAYGTSSKDQTAYNRGRLGDATGEVISSTEYAWYGDFGGIPNSVGMWSWRGGRNSSDTGAGVFNGGTSDGYNSSFGSSRAALASVR